MYLKFSTENSELKQPHAIKKVFENINYVKGKIEVVIEITVSGGRLIDHSQLHVYFLFC